ncbi:drug/metabolite transporter permease [Klebsiella michiganensis]|uniref:Drug/metabolite transporter permease n=1 Tax=Klebsiella michiganensis TaxID=1134687 RepID=A0A7H4N569_9ENTR|nr:drug/metabolite transporter permease [Klebsiella michiganensis]
MISWALIMALPFMLVASWMTRPASWGRYIAFPPGSRSAMCRSLACLSALFSGTKGSPLAVSPLSASSSYYSSFFGLGLAAALLHETVSPLMLAVTLGVILCVIGSRKFGS